MSLASSEDRAAPAQTSGVVAAAADVVAVVFASNGETPLTVAGGPAAARQIRQLRHAGIGRILVLGGDAGVRSPGTTPVAGPAALMAMIGVDDAVLVIAAGLVLDERIVSAMLEAPVPTIATWPARGVSPQLGTERIDPVRFSAGIALYSGATVIATAAELGEWDFEPTLLRATLGEGDVHLLDLAAMDTYAPARRRRVPLTWALPTDPRSAAAADDMLIAASQKGCLDWPARFLHPPVEDLLVRILLPLPVTPNMVTAFVAVLSIIAGAAFLNGWMWTGLVLVLITGPLDGVDGKLARVRTEFSRWGDLEHVLDKLCEYGWILCIAAYLSSTVGHPGPWVLAFMTILFALAEALQGEFFRRFTGRQLDDSGEFERKFRTIAGRRNTFFWTYVPFGLLNAWYLGFSVMTVYAVVTFFVMQARLFIRLERYGREIAPQVDANFTRTSYAFLPATQRSSN